MYLYRAQVNPKTVELYNAIVARALVALSLHMQVMIRIIKLERSVNHALLQFQLYDKKQLIYLLWCMLILWGNFQCDALIASLLK